MAAVMVVAMLAAGQTPAMAQVVFGDVSCDDNGFFCDGVGRDGGLSQGLSTRSDGGTVITSLTVSHTA